MKRFSLALVALPVALVLSLSNAPSVICSGQEEKPKDDPRLVAIGGLGASSLYFSYLLIGVTADGLAKNVYDAEQIKTIVDSVNVLKVNTEQLEALRKGELTPEDTKSLDEMIAVMGMIREYAKLLGDYSKSKDVKDAELFDQQRKKTWERLSKLLGIK